jgi:hypothetical protein
MTGGSWGLQTGRDYFVFPICPGICGELEQRTSSI